jgi:1-phosphofructokinase
MGEDYGDLPVEVTVACARAAAYARRIEGDRAPNKPRVTVFGPHPLLSVTIETSGGGDDVHLHPGGQGVWVTRAAAELGGWPVLCAFDGGETGQVLASLLERLPGERRLVHTEAHSGCYVTDRRDGARRLIASSLAGPASRHEADDLLSLTCSAAMEGGVLVVCNPYPAESLPVDVYSNLVADVRAAGVPVLVDLSSPRLENALEGEPDVVKLNDWELAEYVKGPVDGKRLRDAAERLRGAGAGTVIVTRGGEPALVLGGDQALELRPPRLERGFREGCGDAMMGALAARIAAGDEFERALTVSAAAGAATFLRHGLATGSRQVIEELAGRVELTPV